MLSEPPLSPSEVVDHVRRAVDHLESIGIDHERAIKVLAADYGADASKISRLLLGFEANTKEVA